MPDRDKSGKVSFLNSETTFYIIVVPFSERVRRGGKKDGEEVYGGTDRPGVRLVVVTPKSEYKGDRHLNLNSSKVWV